MQYLGSKLEVVITDLIWSAHHAIKNRHVKNWLEFVYDLTTIGHEFEHNWDHHWEPMTIKTALEQVRYRHWLFRDDNLTEMYYTHNGLNLAENLKHSFEDFSGMDCIRHFTYSIADWLDIRHCYRLAALCMAIEETMVTIEFSHCLDSTAFKRIKQRIRKRTIY